MTSDVRLRDVTGADLPIFFEQQLDPAANQMAAFTAKDPADRAAFTAKWTKILDDDTAKRPSLSAAGSRQRLRLCGPRSGRLEVTYWVGREYWGRGIATKVRPSFWAT